MRRGYRDAWRYDRFPVGAPISTFDGKATEPGDAIEREYARKFPSQAPAALDNDAQLAKFLKMAGKKHKVTKVVTDTIGTTRREDTYARLAERQKGNKWFDDNA
jgi:hypothetical protein